MTTRIAVLASGRGSNLRALYTYLRGGEARRTEAEIALVISDRPSAPALAFAREHHLAAATLDVKHDEAAALAAMLREHRIGLVVLAGYLRLVPAPVVHAYRGHIVNIHPALLPAFGGPGMYGERVHRAVLDSGSRVSGATVHFVDEAYDRGAIIAQWPVPVFADDTASALAERVLRVEHMLFPRVVAAVARGAIRLDEHGRAGDTTWRAFPQAAFTLAPQEDQDLAHEIARAVGD